jgi:hypothetical protein
MHALLHTLLHTRLKATALIALAVLLTIAARQPRAQHSANLAPAGRLALFSDFDSDDHPDEIELISTGTSKSISVHLSHSSTRRLFFDSQDVRGTLLAADIDSDQDLDLIWVTPNRPCLSKVWLGDGHGNFEVAPEPARYLNAVAALETSSQGSQVAGGTEPDLTPAITTGSFAASSSARPRLIAFTSDSIPYRTFELVPICLHSSTSSERGPPLYS